MKKTILLLLILSSITALGNPLTLILDWFVNPDHAPIFVAKQQGYFKAAGLSLKIISPADPSDPIKMVASGHADIGLTYQASFTIAKSRGLPLIAVGTLIATPLDCLMVLKSSHITTIAGLKGKTIGYNPGGFSHIILKAMLADHGVKLSNVKLVALHFGETQALLAHKVDAVTGVYRNFEAIEAQLAGYPVRLFYPEENGVPLYSELIFIANKKEKNDSRIKKFMRAIQKGVIYLKNHPQKTWTKFASNHPELSNTLNKKAWFTTLPYFASRPELLDQQRYRNFKEFLSQTNQAEHG